MQLSHPNLHFQLLMLDLYAFLLILQGEVSLLLVLVLHQPEPKLVIIFASLSRVIAELELVLRRHALVEGSIVRLHLSPLQGELVQLGTAPLVLLRTLTLLLLTLFPFTPISVQPFLDDVRLLLRFVLGGLKVDAWLTLIVDVGQIHLPHLVVSFRLLEQE